MTESQMRAFPLDEVVICGTGRLVARRHMSAVYELLSYMTGDNLFTHQLPRACHECRPYIIAACPKIAEMDTEKLNSCVKIAESTDGETLESVCERWLHDEQIRLGLPDSVNLEPIPRDDHDFINPIQELATMRPDAQIVSVILPQSPLQHPTEAPD